MKIAIKLFLLLSFTFHLAATEVSDFVDKSKCDQIIDKQLYQICYSYKHKGALSGWVTLYGDKVNTPNDIKKKPRFYNEKTIPMKYRTKYKDYTGYGKDWNRGHFVVADADFDYDKKALAKTYTMANIIPKSAKVNQITWAKVESYGRQLAIKLGHINSISIARYNNPNQRIGNDIVIPTDLYRIYYNNEKNFLKCFHYENKLDVETKGDKLRDHQISCESLKL